MTMRLVEPWENGPPKGWDDPDPGSGTHSAANDPPVPAYRILTGPDLAAPLPPIPWVSEKLRITAGAPTMFAGYGYSGKSVLLQSLALSVASGRDFLGLWHVTQGKVVHVDYEQGARQSTERYQRLAKPMGVDLATLGDALSVHVLPPTMLNDYTCEPWLSPILKGASLCIIDSFAEGTSGLDENAAEAKQPLVMLKRISELTGCAVVVIHHARKPSNDAEGGAKMAIRGSSAIYSALSGCFVMGGEKGEPVTVKHEKDRSGHGLLDDFFVTIEDVAFEDDPRWGLQVRHLEPEQANTAQGGRVIASLSSRILDALDGVEMSEAQLRKDIGGKNTYLAKALKGLADKGQIAKVGDGRSTRWKRLSVPCP